ncbi:hypothetical protein A3A75_00040 [Candidatus Woesebacteria bacterium RIFCSPLOWO2_01_FULL_39_10]|uniref:Uncharacterized protein n=1 Tax=Candidatus Woesebacteria bacterium RIFCSPLOWO2_01_FULL_39_10 TaxID=1802516 RepID=A0A1F8B7D7_9BACT|nr:MAG: hypothetical protein A3A75_00040 [Candidatus Woesebacteria bacterium RIFCSPLOWO2_01_FULL_39_10]
MGLKESLSEILRRPAQVEDVAGHIADRISALEQNRSSARLDGDAELVAEFSRVIRSLREQARENGLSQDEYPGLYR